MQPPESPPAYVRSLEEEVQPSNATLRLSNGKEVSLRSPLQPPLTAAKIEELRKAIFAQPKIQGYEKLMVGIVTQLERERMRQHQNTPPASDREKATNAQWQTYYEYIPGHVIQYLEELRNYTALREQLSSGKGLSRSYVLSETDETKEWETSATEHVTAVSLLLHTRVQLGTYAQLIGRRNELLNRGLTSNDPEVQKLVAAIAQAKAALPTLVEVRSPEALKKGPMLQSEIPGLKIERNRLLIPQDAFTDADGTSTQRSGAPSPKLLALKKTEQVIDTDLTWLMSFEPGVPGAPKDPSKWEKTMATMKATFGLGDTDFERALPSERLNLDVLSRAIRENVDEERRLQLSPNTPETEKKIAGLRADRKKIILAMMEWERRLGASTIQDVKLLGIHHAFGDTFAGPADAPFKTVLDDPQLKKDLDTAFDHEVGKFDRHIDQVLGKNGALSLTLPDRAENMWNKSRHQIHTFCESLVAIRMAPRDLIRKVVPGAPLIIDSADDARENAMKSVRTALGFPENYDPLKSDEENGLTEKQKEAILEKMKSIQDVVNKSRPVIEQHAQSFKDTITTLKTIRQDPDANPDALVGIEPATLEQLRPFLVNDEVTPETIQKIKISMPPELRKSLYVAAHFRCYENFEQHWNGYMDTNVQYFDQLEDVLNTHLDLAGAYTKAANSLWPSLYAIGGILAAYFIGARGGMARVGAFRLAARTANGVRRIPFGVMGGPQSMALRAGQRLVNAPVSVLDRAGTSVKMGLWDKDWRKAATALWDPAHPSLNAVPNVTKGSEIMGGAGKTVTQASEATASAAREVTLAGKDLEAATETLKAMGDGEKMATEFAQVLSKEPQLAKLLLENPNLLKTISASRKGQELLRGALKTGEASEVLRVLKAAQGVSKLKVGIGTLGVGADVLGILMAYVDWQENNQKLEEAKKTKNEALINLYQGAQVRIGIEGGVSTTSLVVAGVAVTQAALGGAGVAGSLAAGASATVVLIPVVIAAAAGSYVAKDLEGAAENWLKGQSDWMQLAPSQLLEKLKEIPAGDPGYFRSMALGNAIDWKGGFEQAETSNKMTRETIIRTYIVKTSILQKHPDETQREFEKRFDQYVSDQMDYIYYGSGGSMTVTPSTLWMAREHATITAASRQAKSLGLKVEAPTKEGKTVNLSEYGDHIYTEFKKGTANPNALKKFAAFATLYQTKSAEQNMQMNSVINDPKESTEKKKQYIQEQLLLSVQDYLPDLEAKTLTTDFEGIGDADTEGRFVSQYTASKELRILLFQESEKLLVIKNPQELQKQFSLSGDRLRRALNVENPLPFQQRGIQRGWDKEMVGKKEAYLNLGWIAKNLFIEKNPGW